MGSPSNVAFDTMELLTTSHAPRGRVNTILSFGVVAVVEPPPLTFAQFLGASSVASL